ncbi:sigma factor-like helix-turn-helix DNA-binding protein [Mucilaginibacter panaciglaebae]|uniref:RNA polymerase sigma-70 region 4 domain-containing protein n=1 Tax=Mucilaginibacter panaciglaebae TaxID=502331 RepID=A0ABP7WCI5_9SPHI
MAKQDQEILNTKPLSIRSIYDAYAGMLLGYIFEVVKDHKIAEHYLVKTFCRIAEKFNETDWGETNISCQLRRFAKNELVDFYKLAEDYEIPAHNRSATLQNVYLNQMTDEQKLVFCNIYYGRITTAQLAAEIKKPEAEVKQLLKEAFAVIRRLHER